MAGEFIHTLGDASQLPGLIKGIFLKGRRERRIAMVGRSNVGKSSLINALMGGTLAQVSKEPGKTRNIHFYLWKEAAKLIADLPGFGYAKTGHDERNRWAVFIEAYLKEDFGNFSQVLVLLDARHGPTENDQEAIRFLARSRLPLTFVFTKSDQLKTQAERAARKKETSLALQEFGYNPEKAFWVSVKSKDGLKPLSTFLIQAP
ncbi:MAG: ribosome biogenesis GTP-binding protein YihA/YsxC [Bdellovibrionota bacterium]